MTGEPIVYDAEGIEGWALHGDVLFGRPNCPQAPCVLLAEKLPDGTQVPRVSVDDDNYGRIRDADGNVLAVTERPGRVGAPEVLHWYLPLSEIHWEGRP